MDASSFHALASDSSKCNTLELKRELVYELSSWSDSATEILSHWSRQEILQILCLELGKERKYTGLTKSKMIEQLLKIVCEKKSQELSNASEVQTYLENVERTPKRQKKSDHTNCTSIATYDDMNSDGGATDSRNVVYCKNSACKAKLNRSDVFCKRCSCCICRQYDDNKDPSLWLICSSDPPFHGISCGMSCHLECALRHKNSGLPKDKQDKGVDGSFCCVSCGKENDLLGSWRKQLVVARDTRRVDILCYRLSLAQKILSRTKHYENLCGVVDEAVEKLEEEVGTLTGLPVKKARGIVNRLSCGAEIQKFCASVVESLDSMIAQRLYPPPPDCTTLASKLFKIEDVQASSVTVALNSGGPSVENVEGYIMWHRKADERNYPAEPTCRFFEPNTKLMLSGLNPTTGYFLKVSTLNKDGDTTAFGEVQFRTGSAEDEAPNLNLDMDTSQSPVTICSSLSNPSSVEDEANNGALFIDKTCTALQKEGNGDIITTEPRTDAVNLRNKGSSKGRTVEETSTDNVSNMPQMGLEGVHCLESSEAGLQITPYKPEAESVKEGKNRRKISGKNVDMVPSKGIQEPLAGRSSQKRSKDKRDEEGHPGFGDKEKDDFGYYVKVIRWLECEGHIEATFRQKFLTWYSFRATPQEVRIVKAFVDTFIEDPESLAAQLQDTFSDPVSNRRSSIVPSGFCLKLWH